VVWTVSERGLRTTVGFNNEFYPYFPRYPDRRREELLPALPGPIRAKHAGRAAAAER
jgi:hypothetical protein